MPLSLPVQLPSAPPPGSSYYISNAMIIAKRIALALEDPVRITFQEDWNVDHPLYEWYQRHSMNLIKSIQLRKEQKAPFFHEYIAFRLNDESCYRLDRRQLPNEQSPMSCAGTQGVEAYDTIEQIASIDDSMYSPSECLVQFDLTGVELLYFVSVCQAISECLETRNYTVQRYNCYFYAQTMLLCICCWEHGWVKKSVWETWDPFESGYCGSVRVSRRFDSYKGPSIMILDNLEPRYHTKPPVGLINGRLGLLPPFKQIIAVVRSLLVRPAHRSNSMSERRVNHLQRFLFNMIHAHGVRVEQYQFLLGCTTQEIEKDLTQQMDHIWLQATIVYRKLAERM